MHGNVPARMFVKLYLLVVNIVDYNLLITTKIKGTESSRLDTLSE